MTKPRTLKFQQIADNRFVSDVNEEIERLKDEVCKALDKLPGVEYECHDFHGLLKWDDGEIQRRYTFYVKKDRQVTWNDVFTVVNSVKAVPYDFV